MKEEKTPMLIKDVPKNIRESYKVYCAHKKVYMNQDLIEYMRKRGKSITFVKN